MTWDDTDHSLLPETRVLPGADDAAASPAAPPVAELERAAATAARLSARLRQAVVGRDEVIELVLVALLADGHVLLEDYPGSGKTTLAKALGASLRDDPRAGELPVFRRIQFTPDLLPSDVTGVMVFEPSTGSFHFRQGPIFAHIVLADEVNRTSPKVQAAMLEAMAEKQVTVDNRTHPLDALFFVIATQNPLDLAGTYPLPRSQLDRFLFKIRMVPISRTAELEVLQTWRQRLEPPSSALPQVTRQEILEARALLRQSVRVSPPIQACLVDLAQALRSDRRVLQGVSTRSLVLALPALQARAMLHGRDYVSSEDVEALASRIFAHRLELAPGSPEAEEIVRACAVPALEELARQTKLGAKGAR